MQSPKIQNYPQNYSYITNIQAISSIPGQNKLYNCYKKPFNQNYHEEHWCETCDRSFPSLDLLDKHKQQHQKCNIDGCQFIAHPKVITKHIQMQHSTGLYHKIAKLNNPEEIKKWRDERKRKYPTKENLEKKAAEMKEKIERGEKMGLKPNFHKNHDKIVNKRNFTSGMNRQRGHRQKPCPSTVIHTRKPAVPKKIHNVLPTASHTLKPFAGIQDIVMEDSLEESEEEIKCDYIIDDDDMSKLNEPDEVPSKLLEEPKVCGALSSLMCIYESSEEEIDDTKNQPTADLTKPNKSSGVTGVIIKGNSTCQLNLLDKSVDSPELKSNLIIKNDTKSDEDSGPEETKIDKTEETTSTFHEKPELVKVPRLKQRPLVNNRNRHNFSRPRHKIPSTLLQKLLTREVQHERNIILQCIRHIVSYNFFDKSNH